MRMTNLLLAAAMTFAAAAPALAADPIAARQAIMKQNGKDTKALVGYLKGETPYDAAAVAALFTEMAAGAKAFGTHFPLTSKTGGKTEAAPAIWDKPAEFKAAVVKFQTDTAAAAAAKPASLDAMKPLFGQVTANCKSCHESFRVKAD
jgi:cytochrome c556